MIELSGITTTRDIHGDATDGKAYGASAGNRQMS